MAVDLDFYNDAIEIGEELIDTFGGICKVKCVQAITNPNTDQTIEKVIFEKDIKYVAKLMKQFIIQDRFYQEAEVVLVIMGGQFKFVDKYQYYCIYNNQDYNIIRHRSTAPGPLEVIVELALRRSGTGQAEN
jgi:hypothetical protein